KDKRWDADAGKELLGQLKAAGLHEDEARALISIFANDFYHSPGLTLFYRLPQSEYDRLLPLTVKPRPEKLVRVGLIQQIPKDPDLAARVAKLVKQLDADRFESREAAQQALADLGRAAFPELRRLVPKIASPEARRRVEELLEKIDSQRGLKP